LPDFEDFATEQKALAHAATFPSALTALVFFVECPKTPYKIDHYEFTIDGKLFHFEPYQIFHVKYPDPGDPYVGIGVPRTIPGWISLAVRAL
jgi:hypothetical protein